MVRVIFFIFLLYFQGTGLSCIKNNRVWPRLGPDHEQVYTLNETWRPCWKELFAHRDVYSHSYYMLMDKFVPLTLD